MSENVITKQDQPFFLKSPHFLFALCDSYPIHFEVSVNPLKITDLSSGLIYEIPDEVIEDSSGPRVHLCTSDGCYRLEIPYYGCLPPNQGFFVIKRYVKEEDMWEHQKSGNLVALPITTNQ